MAAVRPAEACAAVTDLDNTNLMAAEVARKIFHCPHVVARLYNPQRERTYQQLDLDYVCGTTLVAENLLEKIAAGAITGPITNTTSPSLATPTWLPVALVR